MTKLELEKIITDLKDHFSNNQSALNHINFLEIYANGGDDRPANLDQKNDKLNNNNCNQDCYSVYSDGGCRGNPGPGAFAFLVEDPTGKVISEGSGIEMMTTNNRMEMNGVKEGLIKLKEFLGDSEPNVKVFSDSKYVVEGMNSWVYGWKKRGWKKADKKPPENIEIWKELDRVREIFSNIEFHWVKGHAGHIQNEKCDKMLNNALDDAGF